MNYEIKNAPLPVVEVSLDAGEQICCQRGAMSWMSPNLVMDTQGGGFGKMFSKMMTNESIFENIYTAQNGPGYIGMASSVPGDILAVQIAPGQELVAQKSAYLARTSGVNMDIFFQKKVSSGFFGGEGFIMQKFSGNGVAFLEIDGSVVEKTLAPGEEILIDTGYLAMMDATCQVDIRAVTGLSGGFSLKGLKNAALGGEGIFNTVVTGPGRVWLQTMPVPQLAGSIQPFISTGN